MEGCAVCLNLKNKCSIESFRLVQMLGYTTSWKKEGWLWCDWFFPVEGFTVVPAFILLGHIPENTTKNARVQTREYQRSRRGGQFYNAYYLKFGRKHNNKEWIFLVLDLNVSSWPLLWRLNDAEQFVRGQPSLNQCTMGTGKPRTVQCMETSAAIATVMLSGPWMICSLFGTPAKSNSLRYES